MAVFTPLSRAQLERWLERYDLGRLVDVQGIAAGIENSNFFVDTQRGRYVLTLFERLAAHELPFYLELMHHLAAAGVPCPDPVADRGGEALGTLAGKPAALVTRLAGAAIERPSRGHCAQVGQLLARMHLAAADYGAVQVNPRGPAWWPAAMAELDPFFTPAQRALAREETERFARFAGGPSHRALPASAVHADLFRDNVLFDGAALAGVIDFYFAATETWLFDLAVACNDWCIDMDSGELDPGLLAALLGGYRATRDLGAGEREAWPTMLRGAATRFWLSRMHDLHLPRPAQLVRPKDPGHFERILRARRTHVPPID